MGFALAAVATFVAEIPGDADPLGIEVFGPEALGAVAVAFVVDTGVA